MSDPSYFPPGNSPDWLPSGWNVEVRSNNGKNVKSYVDQQTGYRFYSKPKVLEYLRTQQNYSWRSQYATPGTRYDANLPQNLNETSGLLPHRSATETPFWENSSQSGSYCEPVATESLHSVETRAEKSPDWLPSGWTEEVKIKDGQIVKTYVDPLWGHRFYTKPQVLQYLGILTNDSSTSQKETASNNSESNLVEKMSGKAESLPHVSTLTTPWENGSQSKTQPSEMPHSEKIMFEKNPDWLPTGWVVEVNIRNGRSFKSFVDPLTGRRFYSKPKVLEYLENANIDIGMSEKKKMGNDFDINLPVGINDTLESLHHVRISEMDTEENGSLTEKSLKPPPKIIDNSRQLPDGWIIEVKTGKDGSASYKSAKIYVDPVTGRKFNSKTKVFEYLESVKFENTTFQQKDMPIVDRTEGVTPSPQLIESQSGNSINNSIQVSTPKETPSRKRSARKPNVAKSGDATSSPQRVESQDVKTLIDTIHLAIAEETSSRKRPGRKQPNVDKAKGVTPPRQQAESQNAKTLREAIILSTPNEATFRNRRGKMPNVDKPGGETPPAQLVESQNMKTPNHNDLFPSKEISSGKLPERELPIGLPPGFLTEIKMKKTGKKTKKLPYYIDPESGYVFSSKADTWRYIEAGDISRCAVKPKKREEMGFDTKCSSPKVDDVGSNPSLQLSEEPKYVNTRKRTRFSSEVENLSSSKECDSEVVIERVAAEGLPNGWIKEVKTEKFYTDPRSGFVFMSQKDALRYLETGDIGTCAVRPRSRDELGLNKESTPKMHKTGGESPSLYLEQSQNENTPRRTRLSSQQNEMSSSKRSGGEVVERVTPTKGNMIQMKATETSKYTPKMDKTRKNPALQQLKHSQAVNTPSPASFSSPEEEVTSFKHNSEKEVTSFKHNGIETTLEKVAPLGLPPGWIKEIRIQNRADGIRKDTFYTDPVSGYVFSSMKDVFRYVKTGDIMSCAMRPKKREAYGFGQGNFVNRILETDDKGIKDPRDQTTSSAVVQSPGCHTTTKQLSTGKKVGTKRNFETMDSDVSGTRRQTRSVLERDATRKQPSMGNVSSIRNLQIMDSNVQRERRQTRSVLERDATGKQPSTGNVSSIGSLKMDSNVQQERRQARSVLERDATGKQPSTGNASSIVSLQMDSNVQQERRQTRSVATPVVLQKVGSHTTEKQLSSVTKVGTEHDVSQKRLTRAAAVSPAVLKPVHDSAEKQSYAGKNIGSKRSLETMGSDVPQKRRQTRASASIVTTPTPIAELPKEMPKIEDVIQNPKKAEKGSGSNEKPLPNTKVIGRTENLKVKNVRSPSSAKNSKAKSVKKNATTNSSSRRTQSSAGQSKKKTKKEFRTPPSRVSKRISGITTERLPNLGSIEQVSVSNVEASSENKFIKISGQEEGTPCANAPDSVASSEQIRTSEVEKSGENENNSCPKAADDVAENIPGQLETVPETGDIEVEKTGQNEGITSLNASSDVLDDAPKELDSVSEMGETDTALGGADTLSNDKVSNKSNEGANDLVEDQTISQERPMENQAEDQTVSEEQLSELSNKNEAMEDQTVSREQHSELSNKDKALDDQTRNQTLIQERHVEVSNKNDMAMENQIGKQNVSQEQYSESSDKSEDAIFFESEDAICDQVEDQIISPGQSTMVSNKEAMGDQTVSQEQPNEVFNKNETREDQTDDNTELQEQPSEVSDKNKEAMSQDQPMYQFGEETWSDPCLDFAFKTLTGTLPFEENVPVPSIFQARGDTSQLKTSDDSLTMLDFGGSNDRQVDNSDTKNGSDAPTSDISLPDMNRSFPSGSQNGPQQNEWEENKNNEKNELTLDNYARYLF